MTTPDTSLVTGFPSFLAQRWVRRLVDGDPEERVLLLVREKFRDAAAEFIAALDRPGNGNGSGASKGPPASARVAILDGDVSDMDLGLTGNDVRRVLEEVTVVHHLAATWTEGVKRDVAERVNVDGTRSVLELAGECRKLRRLVHFSTARVAGTRTGVVLEEELDAGQRFRGACEETRFRAERLVQDAARRLPITVLRPGTIIGDSRTGQIDRFDGPYFLIALLVNSPVDVSLPLPGRGTAPLHLVPIDFVLDAAWHLGRDPRAVGRTFHLVDPAPLSVRTVYDLCARRSEHKTPRGRFPTGLARALWRAPGLAEIARSPLAMVESLSQMVLYNCRNTLALLDGTGVRCPPFDAYVDNIVRYVAEAEKARKARTEDDTIDPFDD